MKAQLLFNKVVKGLLKQNKKSVDVSGMRCAYRGRGGTKCAIGMLIPDKLYHPLMEDYGPVIVLLAGEGHGKLRKAIFPSDMTDEAGTEFLTRLQNIHDVYSPDEWPDELTDFATDYRLQMRNWK